MTSTSDTESFYRRYLTRCNEHHFDTLGEFVRHDVRVNDGQQRDLDTYVHGLTTVVQGFPDYHWELRHLLIDGPWISAHFLDTGTHEGPFLGVEATGRQVTTQEFALYRMAEGKIAEVWVTADNARLLEQLRQ